MCNKPLKVGVVGAQGYSGRELGKLLLKHPFVQLHTVFSRDENWKISDELPGCDLSHVNHCATEDLLSMVNALDLICLATPADISLELVPQLMAQPLNIIDLSGAFRLDAETFQQWYQLPHTAAELLAQGNYGLQPWQKNVKKLTANPGCYATCALMALLPLLKADLITTDNIIIDAKSAVSGAGRSAKKELLFCETANNFYPYKIGSHQHIPEIKNYLKFFGDQSTNLTMTTQVLPIERGISMSIYASLKSSSSELIKKAYQNAYQNYPLVKYQCINEKYSQSLLSLKIVAGTACTFISFYIEDSKIIIFALIDNLLKGAASQVIENINCLLNLPNETALLGNGGDL